MSAGGAVPGGGLGGLATGAAASIADSPLRRRRDEELAGEGWTRRFIGGPPRLQEMTELYRELGKEVLLDPLQAEELHAGCEGCVLALSFFRAVYTRSRP